MELWILLTLLAVGAHLLKSREQQRRIALLARHLGQHQIEKLMESLSEGYLRALGTDDPARREQIWALLASAEAQLCEQFRRLAADFGRVDAAQARVSRLPIAIPYFERLFPAASFDMRQVLVLHAQALERAASNAQGLSLQKKAYTLSAELFLMQHSCHWFCRSHTVASARLLARHKVTYAQLLEAVAPQTRQAYAELTGR
jgi:hypothetical protein